MLFDIIKIISDEREILSNEAEQDIAAMQNDMAYLDTQIEALELKKNEIAKRIEARRNEATVRHTSLGAAIDDVTRIIGGPQQLQAAE